jgi:Ca2+-binding RTX toxin-like protein
MLGRNVENGRILATGTADLTGNPLNNVLYAGVGNNILEGSIGTDTVSYASGVTGTTGVTVSLATVATQATGGSGSDLLSNIENLTGSSYNDRLTGNTGTNVLSGGAGQDTLTGGAGNDIFDFNAVTESGLTSTTWDVIADFARGDRIDLSTIDAKTATTTLNDAFAFMGSAAFSTTDASGQLRYVYDSISGTGMLYGSNDADSAAEFAIKLSGTGVGSMTAADFIL